MDYEGGSITPDPFICLYPEDMRFMAWLACESGTIETGGSLFGSHTHGDNIVVALALGPGPKAAAAAAHFTDDPEYIMRISKWLFEHYGLQYVGNEHSHHQMELREPSAVDAEQIRLLALRNNYRQLVQLIITYEEASRFLRKLRRSKGGFWRKPLTEDAWVRRVSSSFLGEHRGNLELPFVTVDAYFYRNAQVDSYVPSKIKLLKGKNPIRSCLLAEGLVEGLSTADDRYFPLERIIFDEQAVFPGNCEDQIPEALADKLKALPEDVLVKSQFTLDDDSLILELPLSDRYTLKLKFDLEEGHSIKELLITSYQEDDSAEVVFQLLKAVDSDDLQAVYENALRMADGS